LGPRALKANLWSNSVISRALASRKPPKNRNMIGSAKGANAWTGVTIPNRLANVTPRIPEINKGTLVKSQRHPTNEKIARKYLASDFRSRLEKDMTKKSIGPIKKESAAKILFVLLSISKMYFFKPVKFQIFAFSISFQLF